MLRLGAIVILVLPLALGAGMPETVWAPWLGVGLAGLAALALSVARPAARSLVLLGTALSAIAALSAPRALPTDAAAPATTVDLREHPAPAELSGPAEVTGFFRREWMLAEYAVAPGDLPRQDETAAAQLVPFLGVEEGPIPLRGTVLVARVRPGDERAAGVQTLRGQLRPLEPELLGTFVQASGLEVPPGVQGRLLDTLARPTPESPWLRGALASLALIAAFVCLWLATRPPPAEPRPVDSPS